VIKGGGFKDGEGRVGANVMQDGTVDLQHGTRVDGDSHPCIRGDYPHPPLKTHMFHA
jgi:hypothetical protein